ncbi:MAG: AraC family transcriptional regulator [Chitinophagaceae bacterium]|nr:MAG: AraC family transcriptional regulator [Chitinophagaceae bacterium]
MLEDQYRIPPHSPLSATVQSFWQVNRNYTGPLRERILPKGTVELIFNFVTGNPICGSTGSGAVTLPRCFVNGHNQLPVALEVPGRHHLFGVILQPAGLHGLFGIPAGDFADRCLDLVLVDRSFDSLWHQLLGAPDFATRVAATGHWLQQRNIRLGPRELEFNRVLTERCVDGLSVKSLSERLCYSPRQLSRKLLALTGRNTEENLLFRRYLRALDLLHNDEASLTSIAYDCGFSDQSHFIRAFRASAGMTPGEYRRQRSHLPGHLFELVR